MTRAVPVGAKPCSTIRPPEITGSAGAESATGTTTTSPRMDLWIVQW